MLKEMCRKQIRLDKYLTDMGRGSRAQVKQWIKKGFVTVDGNTEKRPERKIMPQETIVCLNQEQVSYVHYEYIMFYKPAGCVSATEDARERTVLDYLKDEDCLRKKDLFPVGRLDKDTEGLLLLTNDGEMAHDLLSPKKHVEKKYFVRLRDEINDGDMERFENGLDIGDEKKTLPAKIQYAGYDDRKCVCVWIKEGRFHQIKRMFAVFGNEVVYLKRLKMGSLELDETLRTGQYRHLTQSEIQCLKRKNSVKETNDEK